MIKRETARSAEMLNPQVKGMIGASLLVGDPTEAVHQHLQSQHRQQTARPTE
ncbi:hypothetical protein [Actinoallomurus acanthiterrae]